MEDYKEFAERFKLLASKRKDLIVNTLSNIFTMRLIGNKTHGDLAEIGIAEFINQFMYDYTSIHVGKDLFRAKEHEEDIQIINDLNKKQFPVSLKAYGDGPLQLSTDSDFKMFPYLQSIGKDIRDRATIEKIFNSPAFSSFESVNVMPLIYNESEKKCNIMIFDYAKAKESTARILFIDKNQAFKNGNIVSGAGKQRKHPIFMFLDKNNNYICEVRYGNASANALQRGLWTHTKNAVCYFDSLTSGWIDYLHNKTLVKLFALALNASEKSHREANIILQDDISHLREGKFNA